MTTAIMDSIYAPIPKRRILQNEISNDTIQHELSVILEIESGTSHFFPFYLTLKRNNVSDRSAFSNQAVDLSTTAYIPSVNSTIATDIPERIEEELSTLVTSVKYQNFDDILESDVAKSLAAIIDCYGDLGLNHLYTWILSDRIDAATASELVILIGRIETTQNQARLDFLERCLRLKSSVRVRYASVLALAYVNDHSPSSIDRVRNAITDEPIESLKKDMIQLLAQLEKPTWR